MSNLPYCKNPVSLQLWLLMLVLSTPALAQNEFDFTPVDYKLIAKNIADPDSRYYYPPLMQRYHDNDTTLTASDYRHLYLGYTFQPAYKPYGKAPQTEAINELIAKEDKTPADFEKLRQLSMEVLQDYPFDIKAIYNMGVTEDELGNKAAAAKWFFKFEKILTTILDTGDGLSKPTAWHVITVADEYVLLSIVGLPFGGEQQLIDHYDYLKLADNEYGIEGVYFDISRMLASLDKDYK